MAVIAHPAVWLTERAARISARQVDDRFAQFRALAGLPAELSVHCLRHSYVSHLIEDGVDPLFVQQQVGHSWASTPRSIRRWVLMPATGCCARRCHEPTRRTAARGRRAMTGKIGYVWHLRRLMAERGMFATTDLGPLLAERGVCLSREQVYRLVTRTPERLSLATLAALCDILGCEPGDLVEPVAPGEPEAACLVVGRVRGLPGPVRPRRARILPGPGKDA